TLSHPFLTIDGWRPLADLRAGVRIAVPRRLDVFGQESLRECEVKLLAYLIGDGCLTNGLPKFTNGDPRIRADFREAAAAFGAVKVREDSHGNRTPTLHVAGDPHFIATHGQEFAARLQTALQARARSARAVALALGVSPASLCFWSQGTCVPGRQTFDGLCAVLEVEPKELAPHGHAAISRGSKNP